MTLKVRVLGCSGTIAKDCRTTSFLMDEDVLIDAGTGVGDLSLEEMRGIEHVFLTHSHLDHIAALPLLVDAIAAQLTKPLQVYALAGTIAALQTHIFNNVIWPDFTRLPTPKAPLIQLHTVQVGQVLQIGGKQIEVLPAVHAVPAVGYAVSKGAGSWVFSGDTERNPAFWQRINQIDVSMLVIETTFSHEEKELAARTLHLSPEVLADELQGLASDKKFPIYITHTKPAETSLIMSQVEQKNLHGDTDGPADYDIRWLSAGQTFEL